MAVAANADDARHHRRCAGETVRAFVKLSKTNQVVNRIIAIKFRRDDPMLLNGFIPKVGEKFVFLEYGSRLGGFSSIKNDVFDNGKEKWSVT